MIPLYYVIYKEKCPMIKLSISCFLICYLFSLSLDKLFTKITFQRIICDHLFEQPS